MESKLNLDFDLVAQARQHASRVADDTQRFIDGYTTVAVERTICRLLGIDGVDESDVPLPNVVVEHLMDKGALAQGAAFWLGNAMLETGKDPQAIAEDIAGGKLDLTALSAHDEAAIHDVIAPIVTDALARIKARRQRREDFIAAHGGEKQGPWIYLIVATGNIYEDITQATAAARQGADVIAVIRTTGQSLLDYVPYGATTEGFGGTYATQENFRLMREALDKVGEEMGRYIRLCNYCSGLCMPEIAAMGAFEGLDVMLNDALYGILFRDINMQRTLVDQNFSRAINAYAGVVINTGEDNYLTTADAVEEAHTVLASQFLNEQFALRAGLPEEQMGLGHAFEIDPDVENGFLYELAQAEMAREIFPNAPLKYMPPTKFMTGNIFRGHVQDALFNMVTILTGQKIHLLGMMTEAIHTPFLSDRFLAIQNAQYIFRTMQDLGNELVFKDGGIMQNRANEVLHKATDLLAQIEQLGIFETLERGIFADIKRPRDGGKGLDGVVSKAPGYFNPFLAPMMKGGAGK
ncbi:lysine 5,6-aminomutase subunit alpha [Flavonifractor sp. DFI.6.63]|uniref:Lysine 5,6-aminomutase subunit alpha n=1 Tax=Lawsonibacter hominis TaxID=2763053 RepID=A0A8J6J5L2_9FIRM|nr:MULTISPECIES: lysine 5,6-aminomutase subunit alpha [Oscillospiraceae]MDU2195426.1 lysine 5,6-aminomutase subunit alpha [Clostridiales bacterium]MDY2976195.1 lysine 5,6-aminomutase subunit alpha [Oscillospiraceae bacterium]MBC5734188.1 lysine 5,6-aminomutase subunit alpha [Lawsonibacter hominis]MCI6400204.1 lysine 5,6-aminomutase subunit alpha [Lawsonibacter sp.]MCQ5030644.1 lysine 5,6-aminomutase subunit alpha [Flavonifractor sp. DFI.6.63]